MTHLSAASPVIKLGDAPRGFRGRLIAIQGSDEKGRLGADEMERRLVEHGFMEGAELELLHEGPIRRDPIAVRISGATVALRRRDAMALMVTSADTPGYELAAE